MKTVLYFVVVLVFSFVYSVDINNCLMLDRFVVNNSEIYYIKNDIDCGGVTIRGVDSYFSTIVDGGGFTVSNFTLNCTDMVGCSIFGNCKNCVVRNINFKKFTFVARTSVFVGVLFGYALGANVSDISVGSIGDNDPVDVNRGDIMYDSLLMMKNVNYSSVLIGGCDTLSMNNIILNSIQINISGGHYFGVVCARIYLSTLLNIRLYNNHIKSDASNSAGIAGSFISSNLSASIIDTSNHLEITGINGATFISSLYTIQDAANIFDGNFIGASISYSPCEIFGFIEVDYNKSCMIFMKNVMTFYNTYNIYNYPKSATTPINHERCFFAGNMVELLESNDVVCASAPSYYTIYNNNVSFNELRVDGDSRLVLDNYICNEYVIKQLNGENILNYMDVMCNSQLPNLPLTIRDLLGDIDEVLCITKLVYYCYPCVFTNFSVSLLNIYYESVDDFDRLYNITCKRIKNDEWRFQFKPYYRNLSIDVVLKFGTNINFTNSVTIDTSINILPDVNVTFYINDLEISNVSGCIYNEGLLVFDYENILNTSATPLLRIICETKATKLFLSSNIMVLVGNIKQNGIITVVDNILYFRKDVKNGVLILVITIIIPVGTLFVSVMIIYMLRKVKKKKMKVKQSIG